MVAQFLAFVEATGSRSEDAGALRGMGNHPVVLVSWHKARRFATG
jgi:formylglycine-generating enzyme required for sulfatase activity